jgi:hypothetical protein
MIAILMESQGLFAPLWVAVGIMTTAFLFVTWYMIEPRDLTVMQEEDEEGVPSDDDSDVIAPPETINVKVMWNIIVGAFADNVGSNGLFPICLSPLAFDQFYNDFVAVGEEPVLSLIGYKWMSVLVALVVIPSTAFTPHVFNKIGAAGGCVFGNLMTAVLTVSLLFIGSGKPNKAHLIGFAIMMYVGYPFTVVSQLSTGPMLDRIAPMDKRGYVQGLNSVVMNIGTAVAPWVLGLIADTAGTNIAVWTGFGVSILAAIINMPLMFVKGMGPPPKKLDKAQRVMIWEDREVVEKLLQGEYVPGAVRDKVNDARRQQGLPFLIPNPGTYKDDKTRLAELHALAKEEFYYESNRNYAILSEIAKQQGSPDFQDKLGKDLDQANDSLAMVGDERVDDVYRKMGQWFADHVRESGYYAHVNQILVKQMILTAFPPLMTDEKLTPENLEQFLANKQQVYDRYSTLAEDEEGRYSLKRLLGNGSTKILYG